jgi:hypothetical protein
MAKINTDTSQKKLNIKQENFCRAYVSRDLFGNGLQAYMNIYNCKATTAKVQASIFLTNPNICERITELLEEVGFNDNNADKQLLFCMNQYADLWLKLQAIREYNRIKWRLTKNQKDNESSFSLIDLFNKWD